MSSTNDISGIDSAPVSLDSYDCASIRCGAVQDQLVNAFDVVERVFLDGDPRVYVVKKST